jgi:hypothetical protein
MNLDELKTTWKEYDRKLQTTQQINEKILVSMITERAGNRFVKVKRNYIMGFAWMMLWLAFSVLVIAANPFDYAYGIQYIPMVIFGIGLVILMAGLLRSYLIFQRISITHHNVGEALKRIIAIYERPKKFFNYTIIVFLFSQTVLFPLSFLPRSIERMGLVPALAERMIPIFIAGLLVFLAFKLGAFKERHVDKFREDLNELQELKAMSAELED